LPVKREIKMGYEVGGVLGLILLIVVIWAIIKIASSSASTLAKVAWIAAVLLLPVLGLVVWFFIGPKG